MVILEMAKKIGLYKEISPGEYAGPCPICGGALRLRIWPSKNEYCCQGCAVKGNAEDFSQRFIKGPAPAFQCGPVAAETDRSEQKVWKIISADGRTVYITDDREEYARLVAAGKIVFDSREISVIKASGATREEAASFLNAKQLFPGARIDKNLPLETSCPTLL